MHGPYSNMGNDHQRVRDGGQTLDCGSYGNQAKALAFKWQSGGNELSLGR